MPFMLLVIAMPGRRLQRTARRAAPDLVCECREEAWSSGYSPDIVPLCRQLRVGCRTGVAPGWKAARGSSVGQRPVGEVLDFEPRVAFSAGERDVISS